MKLGTDPFDEDTDSDLLSDHEEIYEYGTDPTLYDSDCDGASDGYELAHGLNPAISDEFFSIEKNTGEVNEENPVVASVKMDVRNGSIDTLKIKKVSASDNPYIVPAIAGYMGSAYDFSIDAEFDEAILTFEYDIKLGVISEDFQPRIYYYNETTGMFEKLPDQIVEDGKVTARTTHFSTYILLNEIEFEKVWDQEFKADGFPLDIVFVVDVSSSMEGEKIDITKNVINEFIYSLEDGDRAGLVIFNHESSVICSLDNDRFRVKSEVDSLETFGQTAIYKGLESAVGMYDDGLAGRRKVIVVVTDGRDEPAIGFEEGYGGVIENAKEKGIAIYGIGIGNFMGTIVRIVCNKTGGKYYRAEKADYVKDRMQHIMDDTSDRNVDSNGDGISDYYTELIKMGKLRPKNHSTELVGVDFNESSDYDNDGIKNGDEIKIVTLDGDRMYIQMMSHPLRKHSDSDGIDDYTEIWNGTDPMRPQVDADAYERLCNNSLYAYEAEASELREDDFSTVLLDYASLANGVWDKTGLYRNVLLEYFSKCVSEDVIDNAHLIEYKRTATNVLLELLANERCVDVLVNNNYANDYYSLVKDVNQTLSVINGAKTIEEINDLSDSVFANVIRYFDKLDQDGRVISSEILKESGSLDGDVYIAKYMTAESALEKAKFLNKLSVGIQVSGYIVDIGRNIYYISLVNANHTVFVENMDVLDHISKFGDTNSKAAAKQVMKAIASEYGNMYYDAFKDMGLEIGIDTFVQFVLTKAHPYLLAIIVVRDALMIATGSKEDVVQAYRQICYSDMANAYMMLANRDTERIGDYVYCDDKDYRNVRRYLAGLAQVRVLGEKEFYYWYKDDGLFAGIVNLFNSSEEVRKNTNDVISRVRRDCNILGIRMSEKINYGV